MEITMEVKLNKQTNKQINKPSTNNRHIQVTNDDTINILRVLPRSRNEIEIGKSSFIIISHVHAAVEHDVLASQSHNDTTAANVLTSAQRYNFD